VGDLADACVFLMERYGYHEIGEFINIGTCRDIRIRDLAVLIKGIVGYQGEIEYDRSKPDGTPKKLLDVSRMRALGWEARTSLEEGIKITYEFFLNNTVA
jgi:GDP-L-fucose synthase